MRMKKTLYLVVAMMLACALCACSSGGTAGSGGQTDASATSTDATATDGEGAAADREANGTPIREMSLEDFSAENGSILTEQEQAAADVPDETKGYAPTAADDSEADADAATGSEASDDENRVIIGSDDRVTITDTYEFPYSAIAYMEIHKRCGCTSTGTGFMVQPNVLLTAAHCLVCTEHHETADIIDFYFGCDPGGRYAYLYDGPFEYEYGTSFPDGYTEKSMEWDYGIVRFDEAVGYTTGFFGMTVKSDASLDDSHAELAGYRDGVLKTDYDRVEVRSDNTMFCYTDTVPGNSGGPIFNNDQACGIDIAENEQVEKNVGYRITESVFQKAMKMQDPNANWGQKKDQDTQSSSTGITKDTALVVNPNQTGPSGYVLPDSATHYYTNSELSVLTTWGLYIARNEIAARHGFKFKEADLSGYFNSKTWYEGTLTSEQFRKIPGILNEVEEANIATLVEIERAKGSPYLPES